MDNIEKYHRARTSRDARFDGLFFVAVKTTGIYCRPICPAPAAKEKNVAYYEQAWQAQDEGFRPCMRCRPDASPGSAAWIGTDASFKRAIKLIDDGALEHQSIEGLSERLGISDRYLRKLFQQNIGISPQAYDLLRRCEFAKQLLQNSRLSITDTALASGFGSLRQFNTQFKKYAQCTPSQLRKAASTTDKGKLHCITLPLAYRPPYNWQAIQGFLERRLLSEIEWIDDNHYGRSFHWLDSAGDFTVQHQAEHNRFMLSLYIDKLEHLRPVVKNIRRVLDLDANTALIESHLKSAIGSQQAFAKNLLPGLRLPGIWSPYEAGIRAIIGQQISVTAATGQLKRLIQNYGSDHQPGENNIPPSQAAFASRKNKPLRASPELKKLFPTPKQLSDNTLDALKMPGARKQTISSLSEYYQQGAHDKFFSEELINENEWLAIKGVGPWTLNYAKMRGESDPDVLLVGDLGIKKAMEKNQSTFDTDTLAPWRSYLNMQLWSAL